MDSFKQLKWIEDASYWQLPAQQPASSDRDAFMLGGNGRVSARMGMRSEYSTIDRFMGPEYDSFGFRQNNYFRKSSVVISVDFPHNCIADNLRLWRVPGTTIVCSTTEVKLIDHNSGRVLADDVEMMTVNYVLPDKTALIRLIAIGNNSDKKVEKIRLALDATPDIPWSKSGHCSVIEPHANGQLLEKVTEYALLTEPTVGEFYSKDKIQRYRYCIRGLAGGTNRGFEQLSSDEFELAAGDKKLFVAYMAVSKDGSIEAAEKVESEILAEIEEGGIFASLNRTRQWWQNWNSRGTKLTCPDDKVSGFIDAITVHQKQTECYTGGFMVGDDYTQCFVRDCNGSHMNLLDMGHFDEVRDSMEFFFRMDATARNPMQRSTCERFENSYYLDTGISLDTPLPPYWFEKDESEIADFDEGSDWILERVFHEKDKREHDRYKYMTPGDVPNFRVLWHWWYHLRTGDTELVKNHWSYLMALIRLQRLEQFGYLSGYSRDETYGIWFDGDLRRGDSADNSFVALAAAGAMATMAQRLDKAEDAGELTKLADNIQTAIDEKLWSESAGHYAMRITPEGQLDRQPCSPGLLRPLWTGALSPDNDRVAKSVEYVLDNMLLDGGFIRITDGFDTTAGHFPAYLLVSLCKLDHPAAEKAFNDLMGYVNPGGTCAEYYDFAMPRPKPHIHRGRNWETGINADAVLYYLTGFEPDAWEKSFTLKPHLPTGWDGFKTERMRMGNSLIDLEVKAKDDEIIYRISHKGDEQLTMIADFVVPDSWDNASVSLNGKPADCKVQTSRYAVKTIPLQTTLSLNCEMIVEIKR